jgi:uncharacterized protein YacL
MIQNWQKLIVPLAVIIGGAALLGAGKPAKKSRGKRGLQALYCVFCDEPADSRVDGKKYCDKHADERILEVEAEEDRDYNQKRR